MQNRELCWGRRAVERFTVDKESQIEALRQIGIDVALYEELERKAAVEAEIKKAILRQEQSQDNDYFRYMKPGKQTAKEKELKFKIAALIPIVSGQRQTVALLEKQITSLNEEIASSWKNTNKFVSDCLNDDARLEENTPKLYSNFKKSVNMQLLDRERLKTHIDQDISLLQSECEALDKKISWQKTHVEYIRNYERLGLPRDLRKISHLQSELEALKSKDFSSYENISDVPEIQELNLELQKHCQKYGNYLAEKAFSGTVPPGLLELVLTNRRLSAEISGIVEEQLTIKSEVTELENNIENMPSSKVSTIVKNILYPKFSEEKLFPSSALQVE